MTRTRALWLMVAGPALVVGLMTVPALAVIPDCIYDADMALVNQRFNEVAPAGSDMRSEGDAWRAQQEIRGVSRSGQTIQGVANIAQTYGYQWDCATSSFVRSGGSTAVPSTTSTTTAPITSTTARPTTSTTRKTSLPASTGASTVTTAWQPPTTASPTTATAPAPSSTTTGAAVQEGRAAAAPAASDDGGPGGVPVVLLAVLSLLGMGGGYLVSRRFAK